MKTYLIVAVVVIGLLLLLFIYESHEQKKRLKRLLLKAKESYGKLNDKSLSPDDMESVKKFFYLCTHKGYNNVSLKYQSS